MGGEVSRERLDMVQSLRNLSTPCSPKALLLLPQPLVRGLKILQPRLPRRAPAARDACRQGLT